MKNQTTVVGFSVCQVPAPTACVAKGGGAVTPRDILASLVWCTEKKMGQQGRMLSTKEQEAWLMCHV